jgi:hypothetical protein
MQAEMEINTKKEQVKGSINKSDVAAAAKSQILQNVMKNNTNLVKARQEDMLENQKKDLENRQEEN